MAFNVPSDDEATIDNAELSRRHASKKGHRRASSAEAATRPASSHFASSSPSSKSPQESPPSKKKMKKQRPNSDSEINVSTGSKPFEEPALAVNRDHLTLRPSVQQHDFIVRREGYNGFYYNAGFNTGVEPYGYPDKELPAFLDGQMPDRISYDEWAAHKRVEKAASASPKRDRRTGRGRKVREDVDVDGDDETLRD